MHGSLNGIFSPKANEFTLKNNYLLEMFSLRNNLATLARRTTMLK